MTFTQVFAGIEGAAILLGIWFLNWLLNVLAAQRRALTDAQATIRLYRETRDYSDAQIRSLLEQNERLARRLVEAKAGPPPIVLQTRDLLIASVEGRES